MIDFPSIHKRAMLKKCKYGMLSAPVKKFFCPLDEFGKMKMRRSILRTKTFHSMLYSTLGGESDEVSCPPEPLTFGELLRIFKMSNCGNRISHGQRLLHQKDPAMNTIEQSKRERDDRDD